MSLTIDRLAVFVNPAAGGGRAVRVWDRLLRAAPELGRARLILDSDAESARRELDASFADADAVVALGGDGTAHLVVNRLLETGAAGRVAFGLIPAGTGSDLARSVGWPRSPTEGWRRLRAAEPCAIDVLEVVTDDGRRRFVVNIASAGVSGAVGEQVNSVDDRGRLTYLLGTIRGLLAYDPVPCRVEVDGEELCDGAFFAVAVANGQVFGRGMRMAPRASVDDGLADVVLVPTFPLWQIPFRIGPFYAGRHLGWRGVLCVRGRSVRIEPRGEMPPFDVDGETIASAPATIRVVPKAIRILV